MNGRRSLALLLALVVSVAGAACSRSASPRPADRTPVDVGARRAFWDLYRRASEARTAGRLEDAIPLYRGALQQQPGHEDSLYYLGNCLLERQQFSEALDAYRRLVSLNPSGSSRGYMQLAAIRGSLEPGAPVDLDDSAALFQRALEVDPDSGALLGLAEVAILQQRTAEAEGLLARVEADNAMSIAAPYLRGHLAYERGDVHAAWRFFETAVARGHPKKGAVMWTEEGDVKDTPELRWRALARQSLFGPYWIRLRTYVASPGLNRTTMRVEYEALAQRLRGERR